MVWEVRGSNSAGSHQFLKLGPIDLMPGLDFKDPKYLKKMESGEEMESREKRWKAERGDGK